MSNFTAAAALETDTTKRCSTVGTTDVDGKPICHDCSGNAVVVVTTLTGEKCRDCEKVSTTSNAPFGWRGRNGIEIMGEAVERG